MNEAFTPAENSPLPSDVTVEIVDEVDGELVDSAKTFSSELSSVNQVEVSEEWLYQIIKNDSTDLLVARSEDGVVRGMAVLVVFPTLVNPRGLIETIATDPQFRRKGVAEAIVKEALERAKEKKVNTVRVSTGKENAASNGLFQKLGGEPEEDYVWYDFELSVGPQ